MRKLRITVGNKSYEVTVEDLSGEDAFPTTPTPKAARPIGPPATPVAPAGPKAASKSQEPAGAGAVTSPMAGVIRSVLVKAGDAVERGQGLVVLEAMKMENQVTAPMVGNVKSVDVNEGDSVAEGQVLLVLE